MLIAGVGFVETCEVLEDNFPHAFLLLSVVHSGDGRAAEEDRISVYKYNMISYCL